MRTDEIRARLDRATGTELERLFSDYLNDISYLLSRIEKAEAVCEAAKKFEADILPRYCGGERDKRPNMHVQLGNLMDLMDALEAWAEEAKAAEACWISFKR